MSDSPFKKTGIILSPQSGPLAKVVANEFAPGLVKKPHIDVMLADAYIVINRELSALRAKVIQGETLSESESRKMANLTNQLVKLAAEEREQQKQDRLDEMSDKELLQAAKDAIGIMEPK